MASKITIVDSIIFDDHPTLDISSIYSDSLDNWICDSESIDDSNLENWVDNSEFLDETFWSLLSSIHIAQLLLDLNHIRLYYNSTNSTLRISTVKFQGDKDKISHDSTTACSPTCDSNFTVPEDIKGRSQVECPLICEIVTNYQDNEILNFNFIIH